MLSQNRNKKSRKRHAFTLVELMVTLVILAMLSSIVTLSIRSYLIRSKQNVARVEIAAIANALDTFYATYNRYPTNEEGLTILVAKTDEFQNGILTSLRNDPWGNPYEYREPVGDATFELICFGADKREGGSGGDKDISYADLSKSR